MNTIDARDVGAFIPSILDDYGLDPYEFRLYCHIARRAGSQGACWEGVKQMAIACCMERKTAIAKFSSLEEKRLIRIERRPGQTSSITLTHSRDWEATNPSQKRDNPDPTYAKNGTGGYAKNGTGGYAKNGTGVMPKTEHKGTPLRYSLEGTPLKDNNIPLPLNSLPGVGGGEVAREKSGRSESEPEPTQTTPIEVWAPEQSTPVNPQRSGEGECSALSLAKENKPRDLYAERMVARRVTHQGDFGEALAEYRRVCAILGASAGRDDEARMVWAERFPRGAATPDFWEGLRAFCQVKTLDERAKHPSSRPPSFANYLRSLSYAETAIARLEYLQAHPETLTGAKGGPTMLQLMAARLKAAEAAKVAETAGRTA